MENGLDLFTTVRAVAALGLTLGLLLGGAWLARRYGWNGQLPTPTKSPKRIQILEKTALTPQTSLHLVKLDDTEHLLAVSAAQTTVIHSRTRTPGKAKSAKLKP